MAVKDNFNNREKIDDFFRDALKDHQITPSPKTWRTLKKEQWGSRPAYQYAVMAAIVLLFAVAGGYWLLSEDATSPAKTNVITENEAAGHASQVFSQEESMDEETSLDEQTEIVEEKSIAANSEIKEKPVVTEEKVSEEFEFVEETKPNASESGTIIIDKNKYRRENYLLFKMELLSMNVASELNKQLLLDKRNDKTFRIRFRDDYAKKANTSLSLNLMPGITYYKSKPQKNFYSVDLTGHLELSDRFSIELGGGVYNEKDNGRYVFNYESYDSVGYYMNVNSFYYDQEQDTVIFDMKSVSVYDSVEHIKISNTANTYTYFQIPLGLQYRLFDFNRFSFSIRSGAIFMLLMDRKIPQAELGLPDVEMISMADETPLRMNTAWKYYAGVQVSFQMSNNLYLKLEPVYQQYFGKLYRREISTSAKHPYSIGFRSGLQFKF